MIAELTATACMDVFSEPIVFDGKPTRGIVATELVELGGYEQVVEKRVVVSVLVAEVPEIRKGTPVEIRGKTYRVDQPLTGKDDTDVIAKVLLR